jgi:diguanylate cyclase (GGDEF) domain
MRTFTPSRPFNLFLLAVLFTVIVLSLDLTISLILRDPQQRTVYSDVISPIIDLLASGALFIAAQQSATHSKRHAIAWTMIGLSTLAYALGDTTWGILELGLGEPPFPSIADIFYIANYPLLLIGVFLLPNKPDIREDEIKKVLDAGIVMVAAFLGFWNFLIGPMVSANSTYSFLEQAILLAYPAGDLVLLWALLRIIYRGSDQPNEAPTFLLAGSIAITIVADCIYSYQALLGTYASGGVLDISWRAAVLLTALAGISQINAIQSLRRTGEFPRRLEVFIRQVKTIAPYFSYLWLFAAYVLLVRSRLVPLPMDFLSLSLAVGGIIGLVFLRQVVTLLENNKLNARLQIQTRELEKTNQELHNEIVERKTAEQKLMYDSLHDAMTGLPNRVLFLDRLGQVIENSKRHAEYIFAVLFVDIDHFKIINDSLGHLTGDQLLISIAQRMKACLRSSDTVARFGGDEFAILLEISGGKDSAANVAQKIQEAIKLPLKLDGHELYTTASIGIVLNVMGYEQPEEILRDADIAMYQAKASGKARFKIFDIEMRSQAFSRLELEQELRTALENEEFQLHYQPIISMETNQVASFEALIRWGHPQRGLLPPADFLSIAEESGLILPLGKWILDEACQQLMKWHQKHPSLQNVSINVNVSNRQFSQPNFVEEVIEALQISGLKADSLRLEITESVLISNFAAANKVFTQLRNLGVQLQIDDFGSGYSALGYLQHFPISAVKIDKSFIDEMGKGHRGTELIRAIVSMTRELGMDAIAEGIETKEQLNGLKSLACGFGQGFLLSKPLDKESAEKILAKQEDNVLGSSIV